MGDGESPFSQSPFDFTPPRVISTADWDVQNDEKNLVFISENYENYAMGCDEPWRGLLDVLRWYRTHRRFLPHLTGRALRAQLES